jgi:hypothetical protein
MSAAYTLEWRDGRKEVFLCGEGDFYVFPDRSIIPLDTVPAWCHVCREIKLCEQLDSETTLREEITNLSDPASAMWQAAAKGTWPGHPEVWKARCEKRLRHVLLRRLAASCLSCGQRQVSFFKQREWVPHPGTGQEVRLHCSGMCSGLIRTKYYDIDGNPLELSDEEKIIILHQSFGRKRT